MQKDMRDIDLAMRSLLADAEVKPSRRVWKGVSASLDSKAAAASRVWEYAGWATLAFASIALVAGIFRKPVTGNGPEIVPQTAVEYNLAQNVETPAAETVAEDAAVQEEGRFTKAASRIAKAEPAPEVTIPAQETADPQVQEETVAETHEVVKEPAVRQTGRNTTRSARTETWQEWTDIEDNSRPSGERRRSVYAKGIIGGNESSFQNRSTGFMAPGESATGITESGESVYGVPFTIGLGARFHLTDRLSIGTGLDYSLLTRTFSGKYTEVTSAGLISEAGSVRHTMHYIGIPLNVYYDLIDAEKIKFYAYAGGEAEYCVSNKYTLFASPDITRFHPVKKLQYSVGAGIGVEFRLNRTLGLYIDPGVRYFFNCSQPRSIRTDKPLLVNFDAGLRFNF